jgi:hypothetical protein
MKNHEESSKIKIPNYMILPNAKNVDNGLVISVGGHSLLLSVLTLDPQESVPQQDVPVIYHNF